MTQSLIPDLNQQHDHLRTGGGGGCGIGGASTAAAERDPLPKSPGNNQTCAIYFPILFILLFPSFFFFCGTSSPFIKNH